MKSLLYIITVCVGLCAFNAYASIISKVGQNTDQNLVPCECGVFPAKEIEEAQKPVLSHSPMNVTCPDDDTCKKMCSALAMAAKAKGPALLCNSVGQIENLYPSIFSRTCGKEEWEYTGLSCDEPICCNEKLSIPCKTEKTDKVSEVKNNAD